jgi:hypothetical protein
MRVGLETLTNLKLFGTAALDWLSSVSQVSGGFDAPELLVPTLFPTTGFGHELSVVALLLLYWLSKIMTTGNSFSRDR